ncbi:hypothetical protein CI109_105187 [Kwoniella shandongensis]|uniref:Uncharacterized protein n=1 Tax=Kwoniella shandongensis TaxID=1734106 RepID=A0A5M6C3H5_9TREE|nr:uncharacterized protein CI109_002029 [Kwoniella shandongensis]KAA5529604.1 hypothetical protein CI109_002029 [Kwoniella shandongensis]
MEDDGSSQLPPTNDIIDGATFFAGLTSTPSAGPGPSSSRHVASISRNRPSASQISTFNRPRSNKSIAPPIIPHRATTQHRNRAPPPAIGRGPLNDETIDLTLFDTDDDESPKKDKGKGRSENKMVKQLDDSSSVESIVCLGTTNSSNSKGKDQIGRGKDRIVQTRIVANRPGQSSTSTCSIKKIGSTQTASRSSSTQNQSIASSSAIPHRRVPLSSTQRIPSGSARRPTTVDPSLASRSISMTTSERAATHRALVTSSQKRTSTSANGVTKPIQMTNSPRPQQRSKDSLPTASSSSKPSIVPSSLSRAHTPVSQMKSNSPLPNQSPARPVAKSTTPRPTTADWEKMRARADSARLESPGKIASPSLDRRDERRSRVELETSPLKKSTSFSDIHTPSLAGPSSASSGSQKPLLLTTTTKPTPPRSDSRANFAMASASPKAVRPKPSVPVTLNHHDDDDESYRPKTNGVPQIWQPKLVDSPNHRPSRARPPPGAYEIPAADTPISEWPRSNSTHGAEGFKRAKDKEKEKKIEPTIATQTLVQKRAKVEKKPVVHQQKKEDSVPLSRISSGDSSLTPLSSVSGSPIKRSISPSKLQEASRSPHVKKLTTDQWEEEARKRALGLRGLDDQKASFTPANDTGGSEIPNGAPLDGTQASSQKPAAVEIAEEPVDILAQFEDYDWAAEVPTVGENDSNTAKNALQIDISHTPVPATPRKSSQQHPTPSRAQPTTPRTSQKRPPSASPLSSSAHKRRLLNEQWEEMLREETAAKEAEAEKARLRAEAVRRKMEEIAREDEAVAEEPDDIGALFASKSSESPQKRTTANSSSAVQSVRLREQERAAKVEADRQARRNRSVEAARQAERAIEDKKRKAESRMFNNLVKNAEQGAMFEDVLRDLDQEEGAEAYPTPDSEKLDEDENDAEEVREMMDVEGGEGEAEEWDLDEMAGKLRDDGMEVDEGLLRDAKAGRMGGFADEKLEWEGFWRSEHVAPSDSPAVPELDIDSNDPVLDILKKSAAGNDAATLTSIISSGVLDAIDLGDNHTAVCEWLFSSVLQSTDPQWTSVATTALLSRTRVGGFFGQDMSNRVVAMLQTLGGRPSILFAGPTYEEDVTPFVEGMAVVDRDSACILLCHLISTNAKYHPEVSKEANWLIPILLPLSVDPSTSETLKRFISDAIESLIIVTVRMEDDDNKMRAIARNVHWVTKSYSLAVGAAVLEDLGERTAGNRDVHRWLGMEYLVPGSLDEMNTMDTEPIAPPIPHLLRGVQVIYDALSSSEPNWSDINHLVTFLYAAMSDIDKVVEMYPPTMNMEKGVKELMAEHPLEEVRVLIRQSRDRISDQSDGSRKALVKARLHQLLEISRLVLQLSLKKRLRAKSVGKGLKLGKGGQARLDFGKKVSAS